jgi:hypothetical protein
VEEYGTEDDCEAYSYGDENNPGLKADGGAISLLHWAFSLTAVTAVREMTISATGEPDKITSESCF